MAVTKIKPIKSTLSKALDYIQNPGKTDGKMLVSSFGCSYETADIEFEFTIAQTLDKGNNLAHHLIQSFEPGEVDYEKAHEIGRQLADAVTKGQHEYVLATHIDKGHIHNHIIFCAVNFVDYHKYNSNKRSYYGIRNISDRLCRENGLSVVVPGKGSKGKSYAEYQAEKTGTSWKGKLKIAVDALIPQVSSLEELLSRLQAAKTLNFLTEHKIEQYADLTAKISEIAAASEQASDSLKVAEKRLADMVVLMKNVTTYQKTKPAYDAYRKAKNKDRYRADYGKQTLKELSKELTKEFGKGFSVSNLQFMRRFYQSYQIQQTVSVKLSWSHYCELLTISDPDKRSFYEKETINSGWSIRELKRQISTSLYERLLLSEGKTNKETVLALVEKGIEMSTPLDIIKDPYVFEFLGVPENKPMLESDLEKALVAQIEKFLLELGRGFMFVGTQQRITLNNTHYYVDMVFYNKILLAYVLIELKTTKLTPEAVGQLNMYLNYYEAEINDEQDNPPIGIILCTDKDSIAAEYALGGLSNNIFASRYVSYIPDKEQLIEQVEAVLHKWNK